MKIGEFAREPRQPRFGGFGEQFADGLKELGELQRLFEERAGAGGDRGEELIGLSGDDDDGQQRFDFGEPLKNLPAIFPAQAHIEQHQIGRCGVRGVQRFAAIGGGEDAVTFICQNAHQHGTDGRIIIHD